MHSVRVFSWCRNFNSYNHEVFLTKYILFATLELMGWKLIKFSIPVIYDLGSV